MCSVTQTVMDQLTTTVQQFLDEGRMFTGYDVTIETRNREGIKLRHEECRGAIHEIQVLNDAIEFGHTLPNSAVVNWSRSQRSMPGGGWAFVYHPSNIDPSQYQPRNTGTAQPSPALPGGMSSVSTPAPALSISSIPSDSGGEQDDGTFLTDHRNRLMIPTRFLQEAALKAGDTVYVFGDPNSKSVIVTGDQNPPPNYISITKQTVERNGDIRLSSKTLGSAQLQGSKFVIESTDNGSNKVVEIKVA